MDVKRTQPYNDPVLAELEMAAKASETKRDMDDDEDEFLPSDVILDIDELDTDFEAEEDTAEEMESIDEEA